MSIEYLLQTEDGHYLPVSALPDTLTMPSPRKNTTFLPRVHRGRAGRPGRWSRAQPYRSRAWHECLSSHCQSVVRLPYPPSTNHVGETGCKILRQLTDIHHTEMDGRPHILELKAQGVTSR